MRTTIKKIKQGTPYFTTLVILLSVLLLISLSAAVTFGNADISFQQVYLVIGWEAFHFEQLAEYSSGAVHDVVWLIRLPRVLLAAEIGLGLSVCGAVMQAVVKNSLADPYLLGVSSGASLGATLAIMFGFGALWGSDFVGIMAFLGALGASLLVLFIANMGGGANTGKLILAGIAVGAICSAFSNFALYIANDKNATAEVTYWTMGSLSGAGWNKVLVLLPVMAVGATVLGLQSRTLNLMLLGDETSITLGTNLFKYRIGYLILTSFMVGFAVYAAGIIGFVGLVIPHAVRMLTGTDHRKLLPICGLTGAIFLIWADVASRVILKNSEMPIGILVSLIGAPCFIYLMIQNSFKPGGKET